MMTGKRILAVLAVLAALSFQAAGQNTSSVDSTLVGRSIFNLLPSREKGNKATVTVRQSPEIKEAFNRQVAANASKRVVVYRIRIYNDNKQNARSASESAMNRFKAMYPGVAAYRSYVNPFFKVTVGNFHSRPEADRMLQQLRGSFPTAFVVKETALASEVNSNRN
ncbi:MAG: SPOR domain-containing protein [Bacteroidales bacterium]|nr:SPOR domain-containing protein [Bacteroidales bacterium]MBQ2531689.1 SPOR domain-containing protein [Bacteroidales bacterium]MBQ5486757.1 SPOR domain-containing protein [Bacteroidales bacterium]MBQ6301204.1 SPOR domain-containing protein [Bacteroidales bacterium]MCR5133734.1 SPOR domain-containing protein [Bacteroidales bacterium]